MDNPSAFLAGSDSKAIDRNSVQLRPVFTVPLFVRLKVFPRLSATIDASYNYATLKNPGGDEHGGSTTIQGTRSSFCR